MARAFWPMAMLWMAVACAFDPSAIEFNPVATAISPARMLPASSVTVMGFFPTPVITPVFITDPPRTHDT